MKSQIQLFSLNDNRVFLASVELASSCPCCGVSLLPAVLYGACIENDDDECLNRVYLFNHCPNCDECFISKHVFDEEFGDGYLFSSASPVLISNETFSDHIIQLSPDFVSIYNDSALAEALNLHAICGMGYRKAMEFLIKDYSLSKNPDDQEKISGLPVGQCIEAYITDERLKAMAKASSWIGNDQAHYEKRHGSYDTSDLKTFINAFVTFIDADLAYEEAKSLLCP